MRSPEHLAAGQWESKCPSCGLPTEPIATREDKPLDPGSVYAISKRAQEELSLCIGRSYGIPVTILRFFNVYGSGQSLSNPYTGIITIFASRIKTGKPPLVYEDGLESRDFVHISDVVQGCVLAMTSDKAKGQIFNIGSGIPLGMLEMGRTMIREFGLGVEPQVIGKYRVGDIRHCHADLTRAREYLGYEPKVPFDEGMREFLDWAHGRESEDRLDVATRELEQRGLFR